MHNAPVLKEQIVAAPELIRRRFACVLPAAMLLLALACGGIGLAYEYDLTQDYAVWAVDTLSQAAVVQKIPDSSSASIIVGPMVFRYGWNEAFIIAQQHPKGDGFDEVDTGVTHWFIVEVATGTVHGPLTEAEYTDLRRRLQVPDELTFTETIDF